MYIFEISSSAVLIEAIKELKAENDMPKTEIASLKEIIKHKQINIRRANSMRFALLYYHLI
jgi:predicted nucleic-acid-binding protein